MEKTRSTRRGLLKASATIATVGMATSLSGCSNPLGGDGGDSAPGGLPQPSNRLDSVPSRSDMVFYVNFQQFLTDDQIKRLINASLESNPSGPQSVEAAIEQAEQEGDINLEDLQDMLIFGEIPENGMSAGGPSDEYVGVLMWMDMTIDEVLEAGDNADVDYTEETYNGVTIYRSPDGEGITELAEGKFAAGSDQAIKDAIDLDQGSGSAISGTVRTEFENTRTAPLRFAANVPDMGDGGGGADGAGGGDMGEQMIGSLTYMSGALMYSTGDNVGMEMKLSMEDENSAQQIKSTIDLLTSTMEQRAQQETGEEAQMMQDLLNALTVNQNGSNVVIRFEDSVENIITFIESSGGAGGMGPGIGGGI